MLFLNREYQLSKSVSDNLLQDLELTKQIAIKNESANSLVTTVMAQAKLLGIEGGNHATSEPQPISVTTQTADTRKYDET